MTARRRAIAFDLDGTLVDSRPGIVRTLALALREVVGPDVDGESLDWPIGPPLAAMLAHALPDLDERTHAEVIAAFRPLYDAEGWRHTRVHDGVPELLEQLAARGVELYVVTNKRATPTASVLTLPGLAGRFAEAVSPDSVMPPWASKGAALGDLLARRNIEPARTLYVGDTGEDAATAAAAGVPFVWVAWGYGSRPDGSEVVQTAAQLADHLDREGFHEP